MRTLIVGAGATGGYLGSKLVAAGHDVTFLVRYATQARLREHGLQIQTAAGQLTSTAVRTVTRATLRDPYDVIIVAVRAAAAAEAIEDMTAAVGAATLIIPVVNGMAHLDALAKRYGPQRVCGGAAQLAVSLRDGVIVEVQPGVYLQIGALDTESHGAVVATAVALNVDGLTATVSEDIIAAMWSKFASITSTAVLTCLLRQPIGPIAQVAGGVAVAGAVVDEVCDVADAEGHPLDDGTRGQLRATLTDPESGFAPSMFRDLIGERPVEADVLGELADRARRHHVTTPLLDAAFAAVAVHNQILTTAPNGGLST